jgi:hypothetical protein
MELEGPTKASKDLGVSTTLLHKARKSGVVTKSVEIAARAILERLTAKEQAAVARVTMPPVADPIPEAPVEHVMPEGRKLVVLDVPANDIEKLRRLAKTMRLDFLEEP